MRACSKITVFFALLATGHAYACPDPAVSSIKINTSTQHADGHWSVDLTGIIRNEGDRDYLSAPAQQTIRLFVERYGERGVVNTILANEKLPVSAGKATLKVSAKHGVSYHGTLNALKNENASPKVTVQIIYDPSVYLDDNPDNDDCHAYNNEQSVTLR